MKHKDWIYLSRQIERAESKEEADRLLLEIERLEATDALDRKLGRANSTTHI
jgi:hypothetical protein